MVNREDWDPLLPDDDGEGLDPNIFDRQLRELLDNADTAPIQPEISPEASDYIALAIEIQEEALSRLEVAHRRDKENPLYRHVVWEVAYPFDDKPYYEVHLREYDALTDSPSYFTDPNELETNGLIKLFVPAAEKSASVYKIDVDEEKPYLIVEVCKHAHGQNCEDPTRYLVWSYGITAFNTPEELDEAKKAAIMSLEAIVAPPDGDTAGETSDFEDQLRFAMPIDSFNALAFAIANYQLVHLYMRLWNEPPRSGSAMPREMDWEDSDPRPDDLWGDQIDSDDE